MALNKFRLIEEVRRRPFLWDLQRFGLQRNTQTDELWKEIGTVLNVDAKACKRAWIHLRKQFCNEAKLIPIRIAKAKKAGSYDASKKYYCWGFFDSLRFIANGLLHRAKFDLSFENDTKDQIKPHFIDRNPLQTENKNKIPENDKTQNEMSPQESKNTNAEDDSVLQSNSAIKEDPEFQIKTENECLEYVHINELQNGIASRLPLAELAKYSEDFDLIKESEESDEEFISCPLAVNCEQNEHHGPSNFRDEHISGLPNLNDEDYSFLYSFLSQMKLMTQLQKMEFRANMKKLLVHTFPDAASVNILEKQLLLPEDTDPDRKFLINFWPFIKSMSLTQNVQFRAKMADLVLHLLLSGSMIV